MRINEITEQESDIRFSTDTDLKAISGGLQIHDIHFGYLENQHVLQGLSLEIKPGQKVALLGSTGCGKSSLLSLITRDWQAQSGQIYLDGHLLSDYSECALRSAMTVVSQRIYLYAGTLRENLAIALPVPEGQKRTANDARFIDVLQQVGLGDLLKGDKPLDMWIGEGGRQLSGGEQRRIGVARALLRDAPLLLLDEPTEGLDKRTEREILSLLFEFAKDKTLLMISHRLTAMAKMDQIHLMAEGKIMASGNHQSLLKECAAYQALYRRLG